MINLYRSKNLKNSNRTNNYIFGVVGSYRLFVDLMRYIYSNEEIKSIYQKLDDKFSNYADLVDWSDWCKIYKNIKSMYKRNYLHNLDFFYDLVLAFFENNEETFKNDLTIHKKIIKQYKDSHFVLSEDYAHQYKFYLKAPRLYWKIDINSRDLYAQKKRKVRLDKILGTNKSLNNKNNYVFSVSRSFLLFVDLMEYMTECADDYDLYFQYATIMGNRDCGFFIVDPAVWVDWCKVYLDTRYKYKRDYLHNLDFFYDLIIAFYELNENEFGDDRSREKKIIKQYKDSHFVLSEDYTYYYKQYLYLRRELWEIETHHEKKESKERMYLIMKDR